jgi:hypothetical protein
MGTCLLCHAVGLDQILRLRYFKHLTPNTKLTYDLIMDITVALTLKTTINLRADKEIKNLVAKGGRIAVKRWNDTTASEAVGCAMSHAIK